MNTQLDLFNSLIPEGLVLRIGHTVYADLREVSARYVKHLFHLRRSIEEWLRREGDTSNFARISDPEVEVGLLERAS